MEHTCSLFSNAPCAGCTEAGIRKPVTCTVCGGYLVGGGCVCREIKQRMFNVNKIAIEVVELAQEAPWVGTRPTWSASDVLALVAAERERCAKIADAVVAESEAKMKEIEGNETWQWSLNEMSESVNATFCESQQLLCGIAEKIRSGE